MANHRAQFGHYHMPFISAAQPYSVLGENFLPNVTKTQRKRQREQTPSAPAVDQRKNVKSRPVATRGRTKGGGPSRITNKSGVHGQASADEDIRTEPNVEHTIECSAYHRVCVWHHSMTECAGKGCASLAEYIRENFTSGEWYSNNMLL